MLSFFSCLHQTPTKQYIPTHRCTQRLRKIKEKCEKGNVADNTTQRQLLHGIADKQLLGTVESVLVQRSMLYWGAS